MIVYCSHAGVTFCCHSQVMHIFYYCRHLYLIFDKEITTHLMGM